MSSELPERPSLDHLKKQAKDRLATLRQGSPAMRLADAQHALARDYGFKNWAALKAHVESLAHNYQFERYTPEARRVLYFSRDEAFKRGSATIEPEHVMLGLARGGHVTPERVRALIPLGATLRDPGDPLPASAMIPFSMATLAVLKRVAAAARGRTGEIGVTDLLSEVGR
jgi:hypothetical protein